MPQPVALSAAEWIALALTIPMFVSGFVFKTYDIAMASLPAEILRQLNAPFVVAELLVIGTAVRRGFRAQAAMAALDRPARLALLFFLSTFWIGGVFVSTAAPFATLFNLTYAVHALFLGAVAHLGQGVTREQAAAFLRVLVIGLLAFAAFIAVRFLNPPAGRPIGTISWQFAVPGFISVRLFGAMVAPWAAIAIYLAVKRGDEPLYRRWIYLACIITSAMVVWSGTRAAVLGLIVAGGVALILDKPRLRARTVLPTTAAVVMGLILAYGLLPYNDTDFWLIVPTDFAGDADQLASGRLQLWLATWDAFLTVPLFGAGPGATAWILPGSVVPHIQPHNFVLEFLLNWGFLAALAACYLLAITVIAAHRAARRATDAVPFVLAADCLLTMAFVDGIFHFAQHLMMWAACMGFAFAQAHKVECKPMR